MDLPQGIYERVVSKAIDRALEDIDRNSKEILLDRIDLDDSPDIMSRYMQQVIKRGLEIIRTNTKKIAPGKDADKEAAAIKAEIDTCNHMI